MLLKQLIYNDGPGRIGLSSLLFDLVFFLTLDTEYKVKAAELHSL